VGSEGLGPAPARCVGTIEAGSRGPALTIVAEEVESSSGLSNNGTGNNPGAPKRWVRYGDWVGLDVDTVISLAVVGALVIGIAVWLRGLQTLKEL